MFILFQLQFSEVSEVDGGPFQFVESDHTTFWKDKKGKINQVSLLHEMSCNFQPRFCSLMNSAGSESHPRSLKV